MRQLSERWSKQNIGLFVELSILYQLIIVNYLFYSLKSAIIFYKVEHFVSENNMNLDYATADCATAIINIKIKLTLLQTALLEHLCVSYISLN